MDSSITVKEEVTCEIIPKDEAQLFAANNLEINPSKKPHVITNVGSNNDSCLINAVQAINDAGDNCDFGTVMKKEINCIKEEEFDIKDEVFYESDNAEISSQAETPIVCNVCHTTVSETHMKKYTTGYYNKTFVCINCTEKKNNVFDDTKSNLTQHKQIFRCKGIFACDVCDYKCGRPSNLIIHKRSHSGEKPFGCNICDYKCSTKTGYVRHVRTHTGEKPFACDICGHKCSEKGKLIIHKRTHTGEKPFSCDICDYKCSIKTSLIRHMRTHTGEKPFSCNICEYKSAQKNKLVRHMLIHTGEKPFSCGICEYKCSQKSRLFAHRLIHVSKEQLSCDVCGYKSLVISSFVKHKRTHSKNINICK